MQDIMNVNLTQVKEKEKNDNETEDANPTPITYHSPNGFAFKNIDYNQASATLESIRSKRSDVKEKEKLKELEH